MLPRHPHPKRPQSASPASWRGKLRVPGHNRARHLDDVGMRVSDGEYTFRSWQVKQKWLTQTWIIWGVKMEHGDALAIFFLLPIAFNNGTAWFILFSSPVTGCRPVVGMSVLRSGSGLTGQYGRGSRHGTAQSDDEEGSWGPRRRPTCSRSHIYWPKLTWGPCLRSLSPKVLSSDNTRSQPTCPQPHKHLTSLPRMLIITFHGNHHPTKQSWPPSTLYQDRRSERFLCSFSSQNISQLLGSEWKKQMTIPAVFSAKPNTECPAYLRWIQ